MAVKKKTNWVLLIVLVVCIIGITGVVYLFNEIFPKAKPIRLPEMEEVVKVSLECNTSDMSITMGEIYYVELLEYISEAKATRRQSMNDYPSVRTYYGIKIETHDINYHYFIYEEGSSVYVEIPYE